MDDLSRFLAPIHYWLFNKVKYHEHLEGEIVRAFREVYGDDILEIQKEAAEKYGEKTAEGDLEGMIDLQNIHGWLQRKIGESELRQAGIIASILERYREESLPILEQVHRQVGAEYGAVAKSELGNTDIIPEQIYKTLNDYILDGMPCDNVRQVVSSDSDLLSYVQVQCLHLPYWKEVGLDEDIMYKLRADWIDGFVSALSPDHTYELSFEEVAGRRGQKHDIAKK